MIVTDGKKILPFYENYKPVEVRRNNVRIAGWRWDEKQGEELTFERTYNDKANMLVHGNSIQDGEPSPENPVPVLSAGECNLLISDRTGVRQSIALPPIRKIGDVADSYNPKTGEHVQRIGVKVFDGTENWIIFESAENGKLNFRIEIIPNRLSPSELTTILCTHWMAKLYSLAYNTPTGGVCWVSDTNKNLMIVVGSNLVNAGVVDVVTFKAYLAAQHAAGTPVTVYYQLAEPVVTYLDPATVPTYPWYTRIEQDGAVKGTIEARVKVVEG